MAKKGKTENRGYKDLVIQNKFLEDCYMICKSCKNFLDITVPDYETANNKFLNGLFSRNRAQRLEHIIAIFIDEIRGLDDSYINEIEKALKDKKYSYIRKYINAVLTNHKSNNFYPLILSFGILYYFMGGIGGKKLEFVLQAVEI